MGVIGQKCSWDNMENDEGYDWFGFVVNFVFAAILTWIVVGIVVWKYNPYMDGIKVFLIASLSSIIIGVVAGIWRNGFWSSASKFSPYSRKPKK